MMDQFYTTLLALGTILVLGMCWGLNLLAPAWLRGRRLGALNLLTAVIWLAAWIWVLVL